ncbi:MAG: hypothetical protein IPM83_15040 [Ignavibacteria bacterium]|nr:hypothetical protein [Ignavibacteria bacterium]
MGTNRSFYDPSQGSLVARLWLDPRDTSIVVAATYGGVMRSSNGGASWIRAQGGVFRDLIGNPANRTSCIPPRSPNPEMPASFVLQTMA